MTCGCDVKNPPSHLEKFESTTQNKYQPFKKHNRVFLQLNSSQSSQQANNQVATIKTTNPFSIVDRDRNFTPLLDTLHNIILELVEKNMLTIPHVKECDPNLPLPTSF